MIAPAASIHLLTPGSPAYALAKIGAVGGLIALRVVMARRGRERQEAEQPASPPAAERRG